MVPGLEPLADAKTIPLTTYKRDGSAVATPLAPRGGDGATQPGQG